MTPVLRTLAVFALVLVLQGLASAATLAEGGRMAATGGSTVTRRAGPTHDEVSRLAFRRVSAETTGPDLLAQRVIDRQWGLSDDSVYVEMEVVGWRSEPLATALSAALPGAGQLYVGRRSGWLFAAAEAAAWGGWWWFRHDAHRLKDDAAGVAGSPENPASGWSFERWANATESDPTEIAALYSADREAFYDRIASDPSYQAGWDTAEAQDRFAVLLSRADDRLHRSRWVATGLWVNHLVAAMDALRVARFHNIPLNDFVQLKLDGRVADRGPSLVVTLEGRF